MTGGSIGQGLPVAVGAALACPGRKVIALEADGSAMYTLQSLWTMARERLDVTIVILANRRYRILDIEMRGPAPEQWVLSPTRCSTLPTLSQTGSNYPKASAYKRRAPPRRTNSSANSA